MAKARTPRKNTPFEFEKLSTEEAVERRSARGTRRSKYSPIYDEVRSLDEGKFVVLRSVDKGTKTSLYQGIRRLFGDEIKMASGRDKDASGEAYTVVIGRSEDYEEMRKKAQG